MVKLVMEVTVLVIMVLVGGGDGGDGGGGEDIGKGGDGEERGCFLECAGGPGGKARSLQSSYLQIRGFPQSRTGLLGGLHEVQIPGA